jgi:dTDP-4-dehydrorhamnose 3,5-epimerase
VKIIDEPLPDLLVIEPNVYNDERGFFLETWQKKKYENLGVQETFVQDNWSRSEKGVLRGLHFQKENPQGKLVSVRQGVVYDIAVDIRKGSETFGQWFGLELSEENYLQMYIPPGFAHGFSVLSEVADFSYKCTSYYNPEDEAGIIWNDPYLNIDWKVSYPKISVKDSKLQSFHSLKQLDKIPVY